MSKKDGFTLLIVHQNTEKLKADMEIGHVFWYVNLFYNPTKIIYVEL